MPNTTLIGKKLILIDSGKMTFNKLAADTHYAPFCRFLHALAATQVMQTETFKGEITKLPFS